MPSQNEGIAMPAMLKPRTTIVDPGVLLDRRDRAERDREQDGGERRHDRDLQRELEAQRDLLDDRPSGPHRLAEVEPDEAPDEVEKLHDLGADRGRARCGTASIALGSTYPAPPAMRSTQTSPGNHAATGRTRAAPAPSSVGIISRSRLRMYWYMIHLPAMCCGRRPAPAAARQGPGSRLSRAARSRDHLSSHTFGEVLIEVVARADLPALHVGAVRDDPVPPQRDERVGLIVEHTLLELAHELALLRPRPASWFIASNILSSSGRCSRRSSRCRCPATGTCRHRAAG